MSLWWKTQLIEYLPLLRMTPSALSNGARSVVANAGIQPIAEPPASTLAAQLLDNLARATQQSRHQDREDFEQLLRIFETESQEERHVDDSESREESIKLIDVVVKAGLEILSRDHPFEDRSALVRQALRSLAVIDATIRRSPALLLMPTSQDEPAAKIQIPFFSWLIQKLWSTIIHETDREIHFAVSRSIAKLLALEKKTRSKAPKLHTIKRYIHGCIQGTHHGKRGSNTACGLHHADDSSKIVFLLPKLRISHLLNTFAPLWFLPLRPSWSHVFHILSIAHSTRRCKYCLILLSKPSLSLCALCLRC